MNSIYLYIDLIYVNKEGKLIPGITSNKFLYLEKDTKKYVRF